LLPRPKDGPSYTERAFVLLANRLIRPSSEHGLARWLETDFVCDRQGRRFVPHWQRKGRVQVHHRQLGAWYRTLDVLLKAKEKIEVALFHRLRDLFSLQPDLVLFDITSTYTSRPSVRKRWSGRVRNSRVCNVAWPSEH
jgi:hypothetical protein